MEGKLVFVYGTLREGDCRYGLSSLVNLLSKDAYIEDFQLARLGSFPGIVPGQGRVKGELHLYSTFKELDHIEGFCEDQPESSLFLRQEVTVFTGPRKERIRASTYVYNHDDSRRLNVIESGDWFEECPPHG